MTSSLSELSLDALARRFEQFAAECRHHGSALYERLSLGIAADPELLALAARARSVPVPNLFFAAAHFLLLNGATHSLSRFYPSLPESPDSPGDAYPAFRSFCLEQRSPLQEIMSARRVQTNEVRRCACLLPAFGLASSQARGRPLALVEVGASAGLNLLWDHYGYDYGGGGRCGDQRSSVQIHCALRGDGHAPIPVRLPAVATRVGLELAPVDLRDPDSVLWLRALIWPEHRERAELLQRALQIARQDPPPIVAGDALDLLPGTLASVPGDAVLCLFHSFTVNQFSPEARERLSSLIAEHASHRDLYRVSLEGRGGEYALLELASFRRGVRADRVLARCSSHGDWLEWLDGEPTTGGAE